MHTHHACHRLCTQFALLLTLQHWRHQDQRMLRASHALYLKPTGAGSSSCFYSADCRQTHKTVKVCYGNLVFRYSHPLFERGMLLPYFLEYEEGILIAVKPVIFVKITSCHKIRDLVSLYHQRFASMAIATAHTWRLWLSPSRIMSCAIASSCLLQMRPLLRQYVCRLHYLWEPSFKRVSNWTKLSTVTWHWPPHTRRPVNSWHSQVVTRFSCHQRPTPSHTRLITQSTRHK